MGRKGGGHFCCNRLRCCEPFLLGRGPWPCVIIGNCETARCGWRCEVGHNLARRKGDSICLFRAGLCPRQREAKRAKCGQRRAKNQRTTDAAFGLAKAQKRMS